MAVLNLRDVPKELMVELNTESASRAMTLKEYCLQILNERPAARVEGGTLRQVREVKSGKLCPSCGGIGQHLNSCRLGEVQK